MFELKHKVFDLCNMSDVLISHRFGELGMWPKIFQFVSGIVRGNKDLLKMQYYESEARIILNIFSVALLRCRSLWWN